MPNTLVLCKPFEFDFIDILVMGTKDQTASEQSAYTKKKNQMFTKIQFSSVLITISHI